MNYPRSLFSRCFALNDIFFILLLFYQFRQQKQKLIYADQPKILTAPFLPRNERWTMDIASAVTLNCKHRIRNNERTIV